MTPEQKPNFVYVWEFIVRDEQIENFSRIYGPTGDWVQLFSRSADYVRTELCQDMNRPQRFMTYDYWTSKESCDQFKQQYKTEFEALDKHCANLTNTENFLGDFVSR